MLGVLCARPKSWILNSISILHGSAAAAHHHNSRIVQRPIHVVFSACSQRRRHSSACRLGGSVGGAASIWHAILPSEGRSRGGDVRRTAEPRGEGSWNVAWDARPARWLHRPDSAWLLFGVCACVAPVDWVDVTSIDAIVVDEKIGVCDVNGAKRAVADELSDSSADYKVTGVRPDGRCLFRAIVHGVCLRSGEEVPDEKRERELADELRAKVVEELLRRREESEWFIEGDFDAYVKSIQQPFVWGGEPELLMACHVLKTPISVFMIHKTSGNLVNIANYGEEYQNDKQSPVNVLFQRYGHYELLENILGQDHQKVNI